MLSDNSEMLYFTREPFLSSESNRGDGHGNRSHIHQRRINRSREIHSPINSSSVA